MKTQFKLMAVIIAAGLSAPVLADPPGKSGTGPHPHNPPPAKAVVCTRKAGTEGMQHEPKDHPMPKTKGMKYMDPAKHMLDCVDPDAEPAPAKQKTHDHVKDHK